MYLCEGLFVDQQDNDDEDASLTSTEQVRWMNNLIAQQPYATSSHLCEFATRSFREKAGSTAERISSNA